MKRVLMMVKLFLVILICNCLRIRMLYRLMLVRLIRLMRLILKVNAMSVLRVRFRRRVMCCRSLLLFLICRVTLKILSPVRVLKILNLNERMILFWFTVSLILMLVTVMRRLR